MRVFLIAGEASGDKLGAALMEGLKQLVDGVEFSGVGGPLMLEQGLKSLFPMSELSVMGIAEILPKYRALKARIRQSASAVTTLNPDLLITIDSPDFCLRVARLVKSATPANQPRCVHYVAPSVWAWRPGRAAKMGRYIDHVLALLPFEPPLMQAAGMECDFVGHPVVSEPTPSASEIAAFRQQHGIGDAPLVLALPGSRRSEVTRLAPVFGKALHIFTAQNPTARIIVPAAAHVADDVISASASWPGKPIILDPRGLKPGIGEARKRLAFAAGDLALAASGTVSLELAAAYTPMVIAYDMNWLSWQIMSRMARIDTVTLVNLVTKSRTISEFLGPECKPAPIAQNLNALLNDQTLRTAQINAMQKTMTALGKGGPPPGLRAAQAVIDGLKTSQ